MKLTFAKKFEKWFDPILDATWRNTPRIIGGPLMMIGIIIEFLVHAIELILSLFIFPDNKKKKKNPLSTNLLEDDNES